MNIDKNGVLYFGDTRLGDREATTDEIAAWELSRQPTPLQNIRAAEAAVEDYMRKATRIATLESALDKAMLLPQAQGKTRAEVRALYRQLSTTFKVLDDLENYCEAERKKL